MLHNIDLQTQETEILLALIRREIMQIQAQEQMKDRLVTLERKLVSDTSSNAAASKTTGLSK